MGRMMGMIDLGVERKLNNHVYGLVMYFVMQMRVGPLLYQMSLNLSLSGLLALFICCSEITDDEALVIDF